MEKLEDLKHALIKVIDQLGEELIAVSEAIYCHPELKFKEREAVDVLTGFLAKYGFVVEREIAHLPTAFRASYPDRRRKPQIAFLAEYDALPELGHACGHNLIAAASVGAAVAVSEVLPKPAGSVLVLGTPGEEGGGGKVLMLEEGVFRTVDAVMMFHPSNLSTVEGNWLAREGIEIRFKGKAAHAASAPFEGINALDAVVLTFNAINALRQHLRDDVRIHGVITHGGTAPNIVPEYAAARFYVRAEDDTYLKQVVEKVKNCARGAALATGAEVNFADFTPLYARMISNPVLGELFAENLRQLGIPLEEPERGRAPRISSDLGNVSHHVPTIQPQIAICPPEINLHTREFMLAARSPRGYKAMLNGAKAMGMTALDLLLLPERLEEVKRSFRHTRQALGQTRWMFN